MALIGQGRQDWQRTGGADSQNLILSANVLHVGNVTFGPFNVAGFSSIEGLIEVNSGGYVVFNLNWYADQSQTFLMATREIAVDSAGALLAQIFTASLGPWLTMFATPLAAGTNWNAKIGLAATTRVISGLTAPTGPPLLKVPGLAIAAGATSANQPFAEVHGGPATVSLVATSASVFPVIMAQTAAGVFTRVFDADLGAQNRGVFPIHLPPYPCVLQAQNAGAGATTLLGSVIASMTGA